MKKSLTVSRLLIPFITCLLFSIVPQLSATAAGPKNGPRSQELTSHWLKIQVNEVEVTEGHVSVQAKVIKIFKAEEGLKEGDVIAVNYKSGGKVTMGPKGKPSRPSGPPVLKLGQQTFAFLNKAEEDTFVPGAKLWSFAPPFGISPEKQKEFGVELPRPPSFAPPSMKNGRPGFPNAQMKPKKQSAPEMKPEEEKAPAQ